MSEPNARSRSRSIFFGALYCLVIGSIVAFIAIPSRVDRGTSPKSHCINNLRLIDGAKQMWALEHNLAETNLPTWEDLKPYLCGTNNLPLPSCPSGGKYTPGIVSNHPTCSIPGHVLP
jgi:hypothetical protein